MNYEKLFGLSFIIINISIIIVLIYHAVVSHKSFLNIYWLFIVI